MKSVAVTRFVSDFGTSPQAPPGMDKLTVLVHWASWAVVLVCVLAFLGSLATIAIGALRGDELTGFKAAGITAGVAAAVGAVGTLLGALT